MQLVRDIMTSTVRTLHRDTVVSDVEKAFLAIRSAAPSSWMSQAPWLESFRNRTSAASLRTGGDPFYVRAHEIANPKVITTLPSEAIAEAPHLMLHEHVHHLVVMDGQNIVRV